MRRVLTILTALALALASLAVGVFTADLPFWRRAMQLPLAADELYLPSVTIGADAPPPDAAVTAVVARSAPVSDAAALEVAVRAGARRRFARLVSHARRRSAAGAILRRGRRAQPVARGPGGAPGDRDGRGAGAGRSADRLARRAGRDASCPSGTTSRAGASRCGNCSRTPADCRPARISRGLLRRSPWDDLARLPAFATDKGVRMLLGNDFAQHRVALRAGSRARRVPQPVARQHAARGVDSGAGQRPAVRTVSSTSACGVRPAAGAPSSRSIGAPACRRRIAAGAPRARTWRGS